MADVNAHVAIAPFPFYPLPDRHTLTQELRSLSNLGELACTFHLFEQAARQHLAADADHAHAALLRAQEFYVTSTAALGIYVLHAWPNLGNSREGQLARYLSQVATELEQNIDQMVYYKVPDDSAIGQRRSAAHATIVQAIELIRKLWKDSPKGVDFELNTMIVIGSHPLGYAPRNVQHLHESTAEIHTDLASPTGHARRDLSLTLQVDVATHRKDLLTVMLRHARLGESSQTSFHQLVSKPCALLFDLIEAAYAAPTDGDEQHAAMLHLYIFALLEKAGTFARYGGVSEQGLLDTYRFMWDERKVLGRDIVWLAETTFEANGKKGKVLADCALWLYNRTSLAYSKGAEMLSWFPRKEPEKLWLGKEYGLRNRIEWLQSLIQELVKTLESHGYRRPSSASSSPAGSPYSRGSSPARSDAGESPHSLAKRRVRVSSVSSLD